MSISNSILLSLNLKENNLIFDDDFIHERLFHGSHSLVYSATLTYSPPDVCPVCGSLNVNSIIKNGTKTSHILLPDVSKKQTILKVRKQRFLCKHCLHSFSASSSIVNKHCFISNNTRLSISLDSKTKISEKDIAKNNHVSHCTVNRHLHHLYSDFHISRNFLPQHLCFDEFKSVKSVDYHMSFLFLNAESGDIVDIVEDRRLSHLTSYFMRFSHKARASVKTICIDMYIPYIQLIKACFPNAQIITDRFHIIQLVSRSLNKTRIQLMNQDKKNYNKLKRYWKLILKNRNELDVTEFRPRTCFKKWMREIDIVDYLINLDKSFYESYYLYQKIISSIKSRDIKSFEDSINHVDDSISDYMKTSIHTLKEHKIHICNSLKYKYSNGIIEGTNNLIKVIKRIAFGYRSFTHFKIRILLIANTMVKLRQ
ncbi:ISL3 family transposase [Amedibacillus sp. YH-ame10]